MKDRSIEELRNELAEDKKTNRKLRYQLAKLDRGSAADRDDVAQTETENTVAEVKRLRLELIAVRERLAERDDAMRVARVMIQEIRQQIEGSSPIRVTSGDKLAPTEVEFVDERLASLEDVTGEINLQR